MLISSGNITKLQGNEIFVFGSNLAGRHGGGAAYLALADFGAVYGRGIGMQGQSYAIPTKDHSIMTLPIDEIRKYVDGFINYANGHPESVFLVTEIGCGLAGYTPKDIAPLFKEAVSVDNIALPRSFVEILHG